MSTISNEVLPFISQFSKKHFKAAFFDVTDTLYCYDGRVSSVANAATLLAKLDDFFFLAKSD